MNGVLAATATGTLIIPIRLLAATPDFKNTIIYLRRYTYRGGHR